ncbi:PEGA domain-containing protein [Pyxidicoccus sp. 3LG]
MAVPLVLLGIGAAVVMGSQGGTEPQQKTQVVQVPREQPSTATTVAGAAPEAQAAPSRNIMVTLNSTPAGASIFEGEEMVGTTPITLELPRDKVHALSFRLAGHKSEDRTLNFKRIAGDTQTVEVALEPVRAAAPTRPAKTSKQGGGQDISVFE